MSRFRISKLSPKKYSTIMKRAQLYNEDGLFLTSSSVTFLYDLEQHYIAFLNLRVNMWKIRSLIVFLHDCWEHQIRTPMLRSLHRVWKSRKLNKCKHLSLLLLLLPPKYLCRLLIHIIKHWTLCLKQRKNCTLLYKINKVVVFFPRGNIHILITRYWNRGTISLLRKEIKMDNVKGWHMG